MLRNVKVFLMEEGEKVKKMYCGQCVWASYKEDKGGYFCEIPLLEEKRLIKVCQRYQLGIKSPRWCPRKDKMKNDNK